MEEEKAAAYYDELSRKGEGAAKFKRGLGFSSIDDQNDAVPERGAAFVSSSSFLSSFVRASSPTTASKIEKESQLQSIQNKLKKKPETEARVSERSRDKNRPSRRRSRSTERDRPSRRRSRSRSTERDRDGRRQRSRSRSPRRSRSSRRSRSLSPREGRRSEKGKLNKENYGTVDYSRLIEGYDKLSPAERVKARMKLQLAETARKDLTKGPGWERFEFDKDAPLDDEDIEVAEDDAVVLKHIGQSFRYSTIEARREEEIRAAHDEAIFGAPTVSLSVTADNESDLEKHKLDSSNSGLTTSLLNEKVLAKQPSSWRDRVHANSKGTFSLVRTAKSMANRWLRPEVYPLFAAVGVAVGICGFQLVRNICINPEVRVSKENRAAGVLENFAEGEKYAEHFLRKYVRNKAPEIMPGINSFFTDPK
ncbi:NADH-ubiquinone reductase complex 1 MLRQ subunit [Corchorus capsularis]|uniref:NADH-ubiquinone reductase complex 1 MLRQ subunit n=2 Tax=Corchorus TaxID=93758 RepID=A0A1R3I4V2_COCAP|nr:NADH-ubiquinone reductase complex 1 MLRQ subunit [Corchorus capsularis]